MQGHEPGERDLQVNVPERRYRESYHSQECFSIAKTPPGEP